MQRRLLGNSGKILNPDIPSRISTLGPNVQHGLGEMGLDRTKIVTQDYLNENWSEVESCASQIYEPIGMQ